MVRILSAGIDLPNGGKILFDDCARTFGHYSENVPDTNCIGEKDTDDGSFMFYCSTKPVMIKFLPRLLSKSVPQRMREWENRINGYGYSLTVSERKEDI